MKKTKALKFNTWPTGFKIHKKVNTYIFVSALSFVVQVTFQTKIKPLYTISDSYSLEFSVCKQSVVIYLFDNITQPVLTTTCLNLDL